jgi:hypothetical protein
MSLPSEQFETSSERRRSRHPTRGPARSTKAVTMKLTAFASVAALAIGGFMAVQVAAGKDPALGPKAAARAKKEADASDDPVSSVTDTLEGIGQRALAGVFGEDDGDDDSSSSPAVTSGTS